LAKMEAVFFAGDVGEIVSAIHVNLGVGFGQRDLTLGSGDAEFRGAEVRALAQGSGLKVFEIALDGLKSEISDDVVISGHGVVAERLAEGD